MYKVLKKEVISIHDHGDGCCLYQIIVDTEADLPTPEADWACGSLALVCDTHEIKILNTSKEWA